MVADSIKGPWSDPLGKPLMSPAFGKAQNPPTTFRDPCVFLDPATGDCKFTLLGFSQQDC